MTYTLVEVGLSRFNCEACGVTFAIPTSYYDRWKEGDVERCRLIYCPCCGHKWHCGHPKSVELERQLACERAAHDQTRADRDRKRKQLEVRKGLLTRMKNRVGNGVCPCCNRHFSNLQNHMKTKHPEFKDSES